MSRAVAALGDAALLLPASVLIAGALAWAGRVRAALLWSAAIAICSGATVAAKLLFHACGSALTDLDVVSPSGHVSLATIFYGGLAVVLAVGRSRTWSVASAFGCVLFLVLLGASRVRTGAHSVEEVVIGLLIGALAVALFGVVYLRSAPPKAPLWPLLACLVVAVLALGGRHFSLEHAIGRAARRIATAVDVCAPAEGVWRLPSRLLIGDGRPR